MKKLEELSNMELVALTDEQIKFYIDYAIAEAGIKPAQEPTPIPAITPVICTETAYECGGVLFAKRADAQAFSTLSVMSENYDYSVNFNSDKWISPCAGLTTISEKRFPTEAAIRQRRDELIAYGKRRAAYDAEERAYHKFVNATEEIRSSVNSTISEARDKIEYLESGVKCYTRYLELASNDTGIADKFFVDAYRGEIPVIGDDTLGFLSLVKDAVHYA